MLGDKNISQSSRSNMEKCELYINERFLNMLVRCPGQMVSMNTFYSNNPSFNATEVNSF